VALEVQSTLYPVPEYKLMVNHARVVPSGFWIYAITLEIPEISVTLQLIVRVLPFWSGLGVITTFVMLGPVVSTKVNVAPLFV
jgi:hypothetical protein